MTNLSSARPARQIRKTRAIPKKAASIYLSDEALSTSRTPGAKEFRTICRPVFPGLIVSLGSKCAVSENLFAPGTFTFACTIGRCRYERRLGSCSALQRRGERRDVAARIGGRAHRARLRNHFCGRRFAGRNWYPDRTRSADPGSALRKKCGTKRGYFRWFAGGPQRDRGLDRWRFAK